MVATLFESANADLQSFVVSSKASKVSDSANDAKKCDEAASLGIQAFERLMQADMKAREAVYSGLLPESHLNTYDLGAALSTWKQTTDVMLRWIASCTAEGHKISNLRTYLDCVKEVDAMLAADQTQSYPTDCLGFKKRRGRNTGMAKPPISFRKKNKTTDSFRSLFGKLPRAVRELTRKAEPWLSIAILKPRASDSIRSIIARLPATKMDRFLFPSAESTAPYSLWMMRFEFGTGLARIANTIRSLVSDTAVIRRLRSR